MEVKFERSRHDEYKEGWLFNHVNSLFKQLDGAREHAMPSGDVIEETGAYRFFLRDAGAQE